MLTDSHVALTRINGHGRSDTEREAGQFSIAVVDEAAAQEQLTKLRAGRRSRVSKYEPLAQEIAELRPGQAVRTEFSLSDVAGLRGYLRRKYGEKYTVASAKADDAGETYAVFVTINPEEG